MANQTSKHAGRRDAAPPAKAWAAAAAPPSRAALTALTQSHAGSSDSGKRGTARGMPRRVRPAQTDICAMSL